MSGALQIGVGVLAQSSLLLLLGLLAGGLLRRRGPEMRAFVYQVTLAGVALGALLSVGVAGRVRPVWAVRLPVRVAVEAPNPVPAVTVPITAPSAPLPGGVGVTHHLASPRPTASGGLVAETTGQAGNRSSWIYRTLAWLWALGTGLLLLWLLACQRHLVQVRRGSTRIADGPAAEVLARLSASRHVRPPLLLTSPHIRSPFLAGILRPAILLPASWEADFDDATLSVILAHETVHLARRDCAWTLLMRLTCAVLWVQPLLWLLGRQWEQASEEACDLLALTPDCPPRRYADCLLSLAERVLPSPAERALGAGVVPLRSSLGRRIQTMLAPPRTARLTQRRRNIILATVGVGVFCALLTFGIPPPDVPVASFNWAKQQGWSVQPIQTVNLASPQGVGMRLALGLRGDFPSAQDLALKRQCDQASWAAFWGKPKSISMTLSMTLLRAKLQQILARHPHFFYAEYWMSESYQTGDLLPQDIPRLAAQWLSAALNDAPAVLAGRCEYNDGRPVAGFQFLVQISCGLPGILGARASDPLCFMSIVTDREGCYYLPVFRGIYRTAGTSWTGDEVKGHIIVPLFLPSPFVSYARVGVLPPFRAMPLVSLNPPFNGKAFTNGKSLRVHGFSLRLSWRPYPGAEKYEPIIHDERPGGSDYIVQGFDGLPGTEQTSTTNTTIGFRDDPRFYRDDDYRISVSALDNNGQTISSSDDRYFRPVDAQVTQPLTRNAIQDALGGDARIVTIRRQADKLTVTGIIPLTNWRSQPKA